MSDNNLYPKIRYYHLRSRRNIVNLTVCTVQLPGTNLLRVGAAFCHRVDSFIKKEGRERALERAVESPLFSLFVKDENHTEEKKRVLRALVHHSEEKNKDDLRIPSWAVGLYAKYLKPRPQQDAVPQAPRPSLWDRSLAWFVNALK